MYKIFAYVGSYRGKQSYTIHVTEELIKYLSAQINMPVDFKIYTPKDVQVDECRGCLNCFIHGSCSMNDDIEMIKNEMLKSDIFIFASPVYFHQVSGSMKTFIDRISSWAHTFQLRGKVGICINVSDINGNGFVQEYLNKVMSLLGLSIILNMSMNVENITTGESFESVIRVLGNKVISALNSKSFPISSAQEIYFQNMKSCMKAKQDDSFEKMYWQQNNLFNYSSFHDMFGDCCRFK